MTAAGRNNLRGADNLTTHSYKAGSGRMIPYEKWVEPESTFGPALPGHGGAKGQEGNRRRTTTAKRQR
jgi:hypothetical protein